VTEHDFMTMPPGDGVAIYTGRLLKASDCTAPVRGCGRLFET
jgi:hypothetical protein